MKDSHLYRPPWRMHVSPLIKRQIINVLVKISDLLINIDTFLKGID